MRKRWLQVGLGAAATGLLMTGALSAEPVTITVANTWGSPGVAALATAWEQIIERFEAEHPDIKVNTLWGVNAAKLTTLEASGDAPDVASLGAKDVVPSGYSGQLMDLAPLMKAGGLDPSVYMPPAIAQLGYAGKVYGLPWYTNVTFPLIVNTQLLDQFGFDSATQPVYISDIDAIQKKVTHTDAAGQIDRIGFAPHLFAGEIGNAVTSWAFAFGGRWWDDATGTFDTAGQANIDALTWMQQNKLSYIPGNSEAEDQRNIGGDFCSGKMALQFTHTFGFQDLMRRCPDIPWRLAPQPYLKDGGQRDPLWVSGPALIMTSGSKHPKEAFEFMQYASTSEEALQILVSVGKGLPGVLRSPSWNLLRQDPQMAPWVDFASDVRFARPIVPNQGYWVQQVDQAVRDVLYKHVSPKAALTNVQELVTADLEKYK